MTPYVLGFIFNSDKTEVALILKQRPAWQAGKFNGVGGHIEQGESPVTAMNREAIEEVKMSLQGFWRKVGVIRRDDESPRFVVHLFAAHTALPSLRDCMTSGEPDQPLFIANPHNLPDNVLPNLRWLIPLAMDSITREGFPYELSATLGV